MADARAQVERMPERLGHALHDRQAEAEAADGWAIRCRSALKLLEDHLAVGLADTRTGVPYLDAHVGAAASRQQPDAAPLGVLHRVDQEVLQDAAEHQRIGDDGKAAGAPGQRQALRPRLRLKVENDRGEQLVERHRPQGRRHDTRLELGNVEDGLQQLLDRRQRVLDALGDATLVLVAVRLGECAGRKAGGVQRLQQVVADGGEEACLEAVGALGGIACARQLVVGALEAR